MSLASELDFSANIRTHGAIVGVILALNAIVTLRIRAAWDQTAKKEDLPNGVESIDQLKAVLLIQGIAEALLAVIFWIGFLKRIRWCLTVIVGYIAVWLVQLFVGLLMFLPDRNIFHLLWILTWLILNQYVLLVTLQLRKYTQSITGRESQEA